MANHAPPYGLWTSPLTPTLFSQTVRLGDVCWDSDGETLVWLEGRSDRGILVCIGPYDDAPRDLTSDLSVRAQVGYGGGELTASHGHAYFTAGGRLYRQSLAAGRARPITPAYGEVASPTVSPDGQWLVFVHHYEGTDGLDIVDTEGMRWPQKLVYGDDFYMQPIWHPNGRHLAWISWNHPQMPWDGSYLRLATLLRREEHDVPQVVDQKTLAGSDDVSVFQPAFSPNGRYLAYISDANGWDNLYLYDLERSSQRCLIEVSADLGQPAWTQGLRTYAWSHDGRQIIYVQSECGFQQLRWIDVLSGETGPITALASYTECSQITVSTSGRAAVIASAPQIPKRLLTFECTRNGGAVRVRARSEGETVPTSLLSMPEARTWSSVDGAVVHGLYYAPIAHLPSAGKPPLIVMIHGGPTSQSTAGYAPRVQFFTTRGYAVLEVNYRGSSGYGRAYRNQLRGYWGIRDVDDVVTGARHLADTGTVDPERMVVMGGSAGGYTVLQTLIRYPRTFKAGICLYGIANLLTLATDTHKFEAHYLDSLVGPLPESAARYRERSPIFAVDRIVDPIAIFQGEEDRVVPKDQAEAIVATLRRNGVPHIYHLYPEEGHGWRKANTIREFYESILRFLRQHVIFA